MNRTHVTTVRKPAKRDILFTTNPVVAVGVQVVPTGLTANADGNRVIKAGQPLGSPTSALMVRDTPLALLLTGEPQGVTQHDIVFYPEDTSANANMIIFGYIDLDKMEADAAASVTPVLKTVANGLVQFVKGGVQTTE